MKIRGIIPFLIIASITFFLSEAELFQKFMPRSVCMYQNQKLIDLHLISDGVIFIAYIGIGTTLFRLYNSLASKGFPFADIAWKFGGFIFFCGLTHLMGVINLWVTYYWLDGIIKLFTAWFSLLVFIGLVKRYHELINLKTPPEFGDLATKLERTLKALRKEEGGEKK